MHWFLKLVGILLAAAIIAQSLWIWHSTGRRWFTQYYRADLDPALSPPDPLDATLREAGLYDAAGPTEQVDFQFRFGLFPSGLTDQALSATTLAVPAAALAGVLLLSKGKPRQQ
jgi:hypothetical protein